MIRNRARRLTNKIVNLDRGIINNFLRLHFVTAKSFLHNFRTITYAVPKIFFAPFGEK